MSGKSHRRVGRHTWNRWWYPRLGPLHWTDEYLRQKCRREKREDKRLLHRHERRAAQRELQEAIHDWVRG